MIPEEVDPRGLFSNGWDVVDGAYDAPGMARFAHLHIVHDIDLTAFGLKPLLASGMSVDQIEAGLWRQSRMLPNTPKSETSGSFDPDRRCGSYDDRSSFMRYAFGFTIRECALYLHSVEKREPTLYKLLLGKDLKGAKQHAPDVINDKWPASVTENREQQSPRYRDVFSPFAALSFLYEIQRTAQNQRQLLRMSFDEKGNQLWQSPYVDQLNAVGSDESKPNHGEVPFDGIPANLQPFAENAVFGTPLLLPPASAYPHFIDGEFVPGDAEAGRIWSENVVGDFMVHLGQMGAPLVKGILQTKNRKVASLLTTGITAHLRYQAQFHQGKNPSRQRANPAELWGMNWRQHPMVGMLDLSRQAYDLSASSRDKKNLLRTWTGDQPTVRLTQTLAALCLFFLESHSLAALKTALQPNLKSQKAGIEKHTADEWGIEVEPYLDPYDCSIEILATGRNLGKTQVSVALPWLSKLPAPGKRGYSKRSRAHLWYDNEGSDLVFYHLHQKRLKTLQKQSFNKAGSVDLGTINRFLPKGSKLSEPKRMKMSRFSSKCAQSLAMMVSPYSLDPMHFVIAEPSRWVDPSAVP